MVPEANAPLLVRLLGREDGHRGLHDASSSGDLQVFLALIEDLLCAGHVPAIADDQRIPCDSARALRGVAPGLPGAGLQLVGGVPVGPADGDLTPDLAHAEVEHGRGPFLLLGEHREELLRFRVEAFPDGHPHGDDRGAVSEQERPHVKDALAHLEPVAQGLQQNPPDLGEGLGRDHGLLERLRELREGVGQHGLAHASAKGLCFADNL
mmetsp:Transcript_90324/g.238996  ORF Transcript_90324/g.238996 Transcript_90324/m.238996 type:complete len:209 (+) Transcript_90324:322-948(+)